MSSSARRGPVVIVAAGLMLGAAGGCASEGGGYRSGDSYVYVSRSWAPKTISLIDTRTGETLWAVDVPVGQKLLLDFSAGNGPNYYMPDMMAWAMAESDRNSFPSKNRLPSPPSSARRVEMSLRPVPEMPNELPPAPLSPPMNTYPTGEQRLRAEPMTVVPTPEKPDAFAN